MGVTKPTRLSVVMTHPVQYYSPWFRHIAANCPSISLTVLYAAIPTPSQQGTGFGTSFEWDTSLMEGYNAVVVRETRSSDNVSAANYFGLDVAEMTDAVVSSDPEVALVPGWNSVTLTRAAAACKRRGIPVIYRGDSQLRPSRNILASFISGRRSRVMLRLFSYYLAVGQRSREYLEHFGVSDDLIFFSPHCVDNDFFARSAEPYLEQNRRAHARSELGIPAGDFVVLYAGKLEEKKRPLDVIAACASLGSGVTLLFVGSGDEEAKCRDSARERGVNAVFAGFRNQSSLGLTYGIADCLALASDHRETWGLVVNEAMAAGAPCVVSNAAGCCPDMIIEGKTGFSFPLGDTSAFSKALQSVRTNSRAGFAAACREHVDGYSFTAATDGLLAACSVAVGRRGRRRTSARGDGAAAHASRS